MTRRRAQWDGKMLIRDVSGILVIVAVCASALALHTAAGPREAGAGAYRAEAQSAAIAVELVPEGALGGTSRAIVAGERVLFRGLGARVEVLSVAVPPDSWVGEPRPVRVGGSSALPGVVTGLARRGNLLFASYTIGEPDWGLGGLAVLDATDLTRPLEIGRLELDVALQDVALLEGVAIGVGYAGPDGEGSGGAGGRGALVALDVLNPASPRLSGRSALEGEGIGVVARDGMAYVLERESSENITVRSFDVLDPALPSEVDAVTLPGRPGDIAMGGARLFVAAHAQGVYMFLPEGGEFGTPEPALDLPGAVACSAALAIDAAEERMAVGDACDHGVRILELPGHRPTSRGRAALEEPPAALAWHASQVWGATGDFGGMAVVDSSNVVRPIRVASGTDLGAAEQVALIGEAAVVRSGPVGLSARAADPPEPPDGGAAALMPVRRLTRADLRDFVVAGTDAYALTTAAPGEVLEVPLDEGDALVAARTAALSAEGLELAVDAEAGDPETVFVRLSDGVTRAAAIDRASLEVVTMGLSEPPSSGSPLEGIAATSGRLLTDDGVRFAVHAPGTGSSGWAVPELVGRLESGVWKAQPERGHLVARGADAYLLGWFSTPFGGSGGVFARIDLSEPASPREVGDWEIPAMPRALLAHGGHLLIASANDLTIVVRPASDGVPLDVAGHATLPGPALDVAADGALDGLAGARVAVAAGEAGLLLFRARSVLASTVEPSPVVPTPSGTVTGTAEPPATEATPAHTAPPGTASPEGMRIHLPQVLRRH